MKALGTTRGLLPGYIAISLLILATVIAYANAWPDVLVHDDKYFAGTAQPAGWADIPRFFTEDVWATVGAESGFYRPLLLLSLALESSIHGNWLAGLHLDNILLHLLVTLLVYGFLRQVTRMAAAPLPSSDLYPLLAALVFAVHPVHTEVVNSIFNRSEMLVALAGTGGLWFLLHYLQAHPGRAWCGLALCYLFALFAKESAVVIPAIAVALVLILVPGTWMSRLRKCLPAFALLLPLGLYLFMRAQALAPPGAEEVAIASIATSVATGIAPGVAAGIAAGIAFDIAFDIASVIATDVAPGIAIGIATSGAAQASSVIGEARLLPLRQLLEPVGVWGQALWLMIWPNPLLLYRPGPSTTQQWVFLALQMALVVTAILQFRARRYALLAALAFFYLAILPASRIVGTGEADPHLAERYLYFPSVGLAIALAGGLAYLGRRYGTWVAVTPALIAVMMLTPLTLNRNSDWADEVRLLESEYRRGGKLEHTLRLLTAAYLRAGEPGRVADICDTRTFEPLNRTRYASHCAIAYTQLGRNEDAERAFLATTRGGKVHPAMFANLALFYLRQGRREDAIIQFERAIEAEDIPAMRAYRKGEMLVLLYPRNRPRLVAARSQFVEALRLQPGLTAAQQRLDRVDQILRPRE